MLAFFRDIAARRSAVFELAKRDFKQQFQRSYIGFNWAFLQPLLFTGILYVIIELGFRAGSNTGLPFSIYLICGMVSWTCFTGILAASTSIFQSYSFLIRKVDFRLSVLPLVKLLSRIPAHLMLVPFAIALAWNEVHPPTLHTLQLLYYFLALSTLLMGLGLLTASMNIFARDVGNIVAVVVQFGFWLTPIFWNIEMLPERFHFWTFSLATLALGVWVYRRLKPHFAEVV